MSDALSFSLELAAERSLERYYLKKRLQMPGLYLDLVELHLKKLGLKGIPSGTLVDSLASLKHDARNSLAALTESGYKYYNNFGLSDSNLSSALYLLDAEKDTPSKYLNVFKKLKEKMGYKTVNVAIDAQLYQVDNTYKISRLKGDVCRTIDVLAEVGYKLATGFSGKKWLHYFDVELIDCLTKADTEGFLRTFHKLKEKLDYKTVRVKSDILNEQPYDQVQKVIDISKMPGNVCKVIDTLAEWRNLDVNAYGKDDSLHVGDLRIDEKKVDKLPPWGVIDLSRDFKKYKIDSKKGLTGKDVQIIKYISNKLWKEALENIIPCSYKENLQCFIECFKSLSAEEKKKALKGIFNCKKATNEEVTTWLDENEPELVREVGLGLI